MAAPQTLGESLERLGVDTTDSPRLDDDGDAYPETYSPLGTTVSMREVFVTAPDAPDPVSEFVIGRAEELLLAGFRTADTADGVISIVDDFSIAPTDNTSGRLVDPALLFEAVSADAAWALEERDDTLSQWVVQGTRRSATAADVNGNGYLESILVYLDVAGGLENLRLLVTDAASPAPTTADIAIPVDSRYFPLFDVRVTAGDFDGDMIDEVALAVARKPLPGASETPVGIYIFDDAAAGFNIIHEHHLAYDSGLADAYVTLAIKGGQFDHDNVSEIAIVLNENTPDSPTPGSFASQYLVFELNNDQLTTLSSGPISATILNDDNSDTTHQMVVADLAVGDLDGDSVDELVFGGLENVISNCENSPDPDFSSTGLRHLVAVYGNALNDFTTVAALPYFSTPAGCDQALQFTLRFTHVNVLDFDGDGDNDIHINDRVYDGLVEGDLASTPISQLSSTRLITADASGSFYDRSNSTMTVSDQTGDGIDDVVALLLNFDQPPNILVFSWNPDSVVATLPFEMPLSAADIQGQELMNPIITPVDVDNDNVSIIWYTGEHFLDFTEPVVLAALAAAPCVDNIGQNTTDSCSTSWGDAQTGAAGRSFSITSHASVGIGVGAAGAGASVKSLAVFSAAASRQVSDSYELTVSRTFSTGPFEDGVVFTSVAMDRYVYEKIAAGLPGDGFVGERMLVNLPRGTDIRLVTREYYNSSLSPNPDNPPLRIDENVFQHTPGDLSTYPTEREKDAILADAQSIVNEARRLAPAQRFSPIEALPGLEVGPVSVGEGGGASELALEYTESFGSANALELGFEFVGETLAGAAASFSVGLSAERELEVSHGDTTLYAGSVGSIPEENYARNQYEFGLFAYLMAIGDQEFEVINFWVEQ